MTNSATAAGRAAWCSHAVLKVALLAGVIASPLLASGPVDFGLAELKSVIEERGLNPNSFKVSVEYSMALPEEGFQIQGLVIRGGSRRAVMYGLLEAADQLRERKALTAMKATPKFDIRAARLVADAETLARPDKDWNELFVNLARARFNRLRLEMPALSAESEQRLARIAQMAEEHAVDLALSLDEIDSSLVLKLLGESIAFKAVEVPPAVVQVALPALSEAGRYVTLDVAAESLTNEMRKTALEMHVPLLELSKSATAAAPHVWLAGLSDLEPLRTLAAGGSAGFETGPLPARWNDIDHQLGNWSALAFTEERGKSAVRDSSAKKPRAAKKKIKR